LILLMQDIDAGNTAQIVGGFAVALAAIKLVEIVITRVLARHDQKNGNGAALIGGEGRALLEAIKALHGLSPSEHKVLLATDEDGRPRIWTPATMERNIQAIAHENREQTQKLEVISSGIGDMTKALRQGEKALLRRGDLE
jgi:hypothetical protein